MSKRRFRLPGLRGEDAQHVPGVRELRIFADYLQADLLRLDNLASLLMLHGDTDAQVPFEQSEVMDEALKHAHVAHRFTVIPGADHQFSDVKDRATLLKETEDFLREHLPTTAPPVPVP